MNLARFSWDEVEAAVMQDPGDTSYDYPYDTGILYDTSVMLGMLRERLGAPESEGEVH